MVNYIQKEEQEVKKNIKSIINFDFKIPASTKPTCSDVNGLDLFLDWLGYPKFKVDLLKSFNWLDLN